MVYQEQGSGQLVRTRDFCKRGMKLLRMDFSQELEGIERVIMTARL